MIDDKNKKIDFETMQIITKEYSYDKPKVTLDPKVIIQTKFYKLIITLKVHLNMLALQMKDKEIGTLMQQI